MSERPESSIDWSRSPSFTVAPTGYWSMDVHRLLDDLERADHAGDPLAPIIDACALSEVGFGYDTAEVNAFLDRVRGRDAPSVTPLPKPTRTPLRRRGHALYPPLDSDDLTRDPQVASLLREIERAKYLPAGRHRERGYDVHEVDRFFKGLAFAIRAGVPVTPDLQGIRFKIVGKGHNGYGVEAVDVLLDRVASLAEPVDSAPRLPAVAPQVRRDAFVRRAVRAAIVLAGAAFIVALGAVLGAL